MLDAERWISLLLVIAALACDGSGDAGTTADAVAGEDAATPLSDARPTVDAAPWPDAGPDGPDFDVSEGLIQVIERRWRSGDFRSGWATAELYDVAPPPRYRTVDRVGACRLLKPSPNGFCDPACEYGWYCDASNECIPSPDLQSAGEIVLTGLSTEVSLVNSAGDSYSPAPRQLPEDLFDANSTVTATAPGALFSGFTVSALSVAPTTVELSGQQSDELRLVDGADQTVTWSDPDPAARVHLWLPSPNDGHGLPAHAVIECDAADTGSLVIAQSLIEAFPVQPRRELCVGRDCPLSTLLRYGTGAIETYSGRVVLRVGAESQFYLVHESANSKTADPGMKATCDRPPGPGALRPPSRSARRPLRSGWPPREAAAP